MTQERRKRNLSGPNKWKYVPSPLGAPKSKQTRVSIGVQVVSSTGRKRMHSCNCGSKHFYRDTMECVKCNKVYSHV